MKGTSRSHLHITESYMKFAAAQYFIYYALTYTLTLN